MFPPRRFQRFRKCVQVLLITGVHFGAGFMEIGPPIVARLISSRDPMSGPFQRGRLHRPEKRIDRTENHDRRAAIPPGVAQRFSSVFRRVRLEGPRRVRPQFALHAQCAEHGLRFRIARDHHGIVAIARAQSRHRRVHIARFGAIADRKLVFHRRHAQSANEHGRERVGELALEHGPFAGDHAVMFAHFLVEEWRKHIRQEHLRRVAKIAARKLEIRGRSPSVPRSWRPGPAAPVAASPLHARPSRYCGCRCTRQKAISGARPASRICRVRASTPLLCARSTRPPMPAARDPSLRAFSHLHVPL